jgi:Na+/proline symporter
VAAGQLFSGLLGWPVELATGAMLAAVLIYSVLGGYLAVVLTDMAQMVLIVLALVLLFGNTAYLASAQGLPQLVAHWQQLPSSFWQLAGSDWPTQIALTLSFAMGWSIAPEMWQRMSSLKNPQLASKAAWRGVAMLSFLLLIVFGIGLLGATLHLGDAAGKNGLLMLAQLMPHPALAALVVLGFLAAVSSTMDSSINVGSLVLTHDLYQRLIAPKASNRHLLWASRVATVLVALPAYVIAIRFQNLIQVLWLSVDVYACALFWPIIGLLYDANAPQGGRRGRWAIAVGASVSALTALFQYGLLPPVAWYPAGPWATLNRFKLKRHRLPVRASGGYGEHCKD